VNRDLLASLLRSVADHSLPVDAALDKLRSFPSEATEYATIDHHRALRQGMPEVVFAAGKEPSQVLGICRKLAEASGGFLATRVEPSTAAALIAEFPEAAHDSLSRTVWLRGNEHAPETGDPVLVVTAGTSDLPVAGEAAVTAAACGARVERLTDVGVAGLHRLLGAGEVLKRAGAIVVVAGMEGALPSVVGGLVSVPVIAVPTSVGYGASFGGLAALLGMLNSCAAGVTVVNIDNGFGAGVAAARIVRAGRA
jgi:NCAIR mutase (PurE)-related protein